MGLILTRRVNTGVRIEKGTLRIDLVIEEILLNGKGALINVSRQDGSRSDNLYLELYYNSQQIDYDGEVRAGIANKYPDRKLVNLRFEAPRDYVITRHEILPKENLS